MLFLFSTIVLFTPFSKSVILSLGVTFEYSYSLFLFSCDPFLLQGDILFNRTDTLYPDSGDYQEGKDQMQGVHFRQFPPEGNDENFINQLDQVIQAAESEKQTGAERGADGCPPS